MVPLVDVRCDRASCGKLNRGKRALQVLADKAFTCDYCGLETKLTPDDIRKVNEQVARRPPP
jgi:hypothetical protein